ncbi:hypothetical protein [Flavobacterium subsaxonicum]|uniref:Uncharacterized protein n=1 Tax=Flavobacterium subsaxonicum WB 4.1-42 = DSM 21790 TaxID=1121898 RepID=A0A0A2MKL6_9FLAO|nr:hypothetical protein [Flavobacterium subsaxonicum]KGO92844.1 hypothetical protein Q766_09410 [Flavobacterium subsaxonicum WB 4.1-42 = DSM 21790]
MPLFPELTLIIVLSASLVVYLLFKLLNSRSGYRKKKNYLLTEYQRLRVKSITLQEKLSTHILSRDNDKELFTQGMSYGDYLKYLQKNHGKNLTDKGYARLKNSDNRVQQIKVADMLKEQEGKLKEAEDNLSKVIAV